VQQLAKPYISNPGAATAKLEEEEENKNKRKAY